MCPVDIDDILTTSVTNSFNFASFCICACSVKRHTLSHCLSLILSLSVTAAQLSESEYKRLSVCVYVLPFWHGNLLHERNLLSSLSQLSGNQVSVVFLAK